jgi:RNase H-fold protein (predicted Holliday junction resolvase)
MLPELVREWQRRYGVTEVVIGNRTASRDVARTLEGVLGVPLRAVDEQGTTLRARARYFAEHPPRGWRRLVPKSLQTPPEPYDDYAAVLLAEAALRETP